MLCWDFQTFITRSVKKVLSIRFADSEVVRRTNCTVITSADELRDLLRHAHELMVL